MATLGWKRRAELPSSPELPAELVYLWRDFKEICSGLQSNGIGQTLVTWEALAAWSALTQTRLDAWEARALISLGIVRANIMAEKL